MPIRSNNSLGGALSRTIPSHGGLFVPSASQAWQNGSRPRSEEPHRRPSLVPAGSSNDRTNPTTSNSTPRPTLTSTPHARQSSSTVPISSHTLTPSAGLLAPGTALSLPLVHHHHEEERYYTSIHTSKVTVFSRRTTSDGRTKVKFALLGVRVERCGVCLMQFREGEMGAKTTCEHVYVQYFPDSGRKISGARAVDWGRGAAPSP